MSQDKREKNMGSGDGVSDETARDNAQRSSGDDAEPQPWAKASPSTESLASDDDEDDSPGL